jgi:hypothetical protein
VAIAFLFILPCVAFPLTVPPFYEDESWTFVPVFEALRGNGFTWAAFGEGHAMLGVFCALVTPLVWLLPTGPEMGIRIVAAVFGLLSLAGIYVVARRVAPATAWIAPAAMVATPYLFTALRYGRNDVVALALAAWSVAAAAWNRPLWAGLLSALAVSVHPLFVWVALPCLAFLGADQRARQWSRYAFAGALGLLPQAVWMLLYWDEIRSIIARYFVSSSVAGDASTGILQSIAAEPSRYVAYIGSMGVWTRAFHGITYMLLPLSCIGRAWKGARPVLVLAAAPVVALALLSQNKNPYYWYSALPFITVATAYAASMTSRHLRVGIAVFVVAAVTAATITRATQGAQQAPPAILALTRTLATSLPAGATVVAPNLYAGLIRERPDIQFFNYHGLSNKPVWGLPGCDKLSARLRELIAGDPRHQRSGSRKVYFVAQSEPSLLAYLRQIYADASEADVACMLRNEVEPVRVAGCREGGTPCGSILVSRVDTSTR